MKNNRNLLIIIISVLLLAVLIYLLNRKENTFQIIDFSNKNYVANRASQSFLDTIVSVGLDSLGLEKVTVMIKDIEIQRDLGDDYQAAAYVEAGDSKFGNQYLIYIKKGSRIEMIKILSHELIHIQQYYTKKLKYDKGDYVVWDGDSLNILEIPYDKRPWELEAFDISSELESKIKKTLLK